MELADRIVSHIHCNYVACNIRLLNKAAALRFRGLQHTTIRLSQPVPPDAFARHWLTPGATRGFTLQQRRKLLCLTAASGSIPNLEVAVRAAGCLPTAPVFEAAAAAGSLEALQWLHQQGYPMGCEGPLDGGDVLSAAAGGGHMHVCEWLITLDVHWKWGAEEAAAEGGHVALMEWLNQRRPQLQCIRQPSDMFRRKQLAAAVARGCDLPTLQRLWPRWGELQQDNSFKVTVLGSAAGSPTPDWAAKVEWLEGQGCPRTSDAADEAAARPDALGRLTWLRGRGYPLGRAAVRVGRPAVEAAAKSGNTVALQYVIGEGVRPQPETTNIALCLAAEGGHLAAMQALHAAGWPVDARRTAKVAAEAGHLHVVAWLIEALGVALDAELFAAAAESGSVELMAWLRQHGCEWDAEAFTSAAEAGCEETLEWLAAQGCPVQDDWSPYWIACCENGDLATARCLRRLGVPWGNARELLLDAVKFARPPMLRCLLEAGCPLDADAEAEAQAAMEEAVLNAAEVTEKLRLLRRHLRHRQRQPAA